MDLYKDGILITIKVRFWIGIKTFTPSDFGLNLPNISSFGKKELIPRKIIHKFRAIESKARFAIEHNSFKWPIGNARFLPWKRFKDVIKTLKKYQNDYNALTKEFINNLNNLRKEEHPKHLNTATHIYSDYNTIIESSEKEFIDEYFSILDTFYPDMDTLRAKYSLTWDVYEISYPKMETANCNLYIQEIKNKIEYFLTDTAVTLRNRTVKLCQQIIDKMDTGKVVKGNTIRSLNNLINDFIDMNFIGDTIIENEINDIKVFINKYSFNQISNNNKFQENLKIKLNLLLNKAQLSSGISTIIKEYKEKINL